MNRKERRASKDSTGSQSSSPLTPVYQEALRFHKAGNLPEAEKLYRQILGFDPNHADSLHMMGVLAFDVNRNDIAEELVRKAIVQNGKNFTYHLTLGNVLKKAERYEDAISSYKKAVALKPDFAGGLNNIGLTFLLMNKNEEALTYFKRAFTLDPKSHDVANNIGYALQMLGKIDEAMKYYKQALAIKPDFLGAINNLGNTCTSQGKFEEATELYKEALKTYPDAPDLLFGLGHALSNVGRQDESIAVFRRSVELEPTPAKYHRLLMAMIYAASVSPEEITAISRKFGEQFADPALRHRILTRDKNPDRKLRIGYVSPDFRTHAVNYFFEPLLTLHDKEKFETYAYSNNYKDDSTTARLKQKFAHWRDIKDLNDDEAADIIEADNIDILIDLTGHSGFNRLMVFARKPAPVQVTWLGYPATTGMKAIDYRVTDHYAEPVGMTEYLNIETLWRLPQIFCCYQAHENSPPVIDHPPFEDNGYITFGCFNNFFKATDPVLETWAKIMAQVPNSRLLLEISNLENPEYRTQVESRIQRAGLPMDRVILEVRKPSNQFVLYNKIDIALDPFPCVGGTTSMDTLWMGVPLITLAGKHFGSRMGISILTNVGLPELIAGNTDNYIKIAIDLALDKNRLRNLRRNLREKTAASPLMDQKSFVHDMEDAYRGMWKKYCDDQEQKP